MSKFLDYPGLEHYNEKVQGQISQLGLEISEMVGTSTDEIDFAISDKDGHYLAEMGGGEFKTKKFDTREAAVSKDFYDGDFYIADENGYAVVKFSNGNIQTKNFDSSKVRYDEEESIVPPVSFRFDTSLLDMDQELSGFNPKEQDSLGCETFVTQIVNKIDALVSEFPSLLTKEDAASYAGLSYPAYANLNGVAQGDYLATPSYTIPIYHFKDDTLSVEAPKRKIFIIAGLHGWENGSQFNTYVLLNKLCRCASVDYMTLRSSIDLYVIPCVNVYSAFHSTHLSSNSRKNANGIDINRNFPNPTWQVIGDPSTLDYSGTSPASEFETQLVINCAKEIVPDIMIDHHSYGGFVTYNFYENFAQQNTRMAGYQNLYAWTAQGCLSYPEHYGTDGKLHPLDFKIDHGQTCTGWTYNVGIANGATIEVSIGIGFENGERYATLADYQAADTEWKEPSIQMNELALRLALMKFVYYSEKLGLTTSSLNSDMLV